MKGIFHCIAASSPIKGIRGKIKAKKKQTERESGFLRIGSLRNFLGVGSSSSNNHHHGTQNRNLIRSSVPSGKYSATSSDRFDKLHKSWGSADNLPHNPSSMPPPKNGSKKRRTRRHADYGAVLPSGAAVVGSHSVPTTPNQPRAPMHSFGDNQHGPPSMGDSDSDSACGFDSNWHGNGPPRSGSSGSYGKRTKLSLLEIAFGALTDASSIFCIEFRTTPIQVLPARHCHEHLLPSLQNPLAFFATLRETIPQRDFVDTLIAQKIILIPKDCALALHLIPTGFGGAGAR
uniref:Uncharacterized protein n=1 Tax=Lutzomyia longipalpis TaxID=7200 RepID=A0A1B0CQX1_LUTLO